MRGKKLPASQRLAAQIAIGYAHYYAPAHHEAASKFFGQQLLRLNIQQMTTPKLNKLLWNSLS
jgi:hypothetical protein